MKISSPTPERMPTTWWVAIVISANETSELCCTVVDMNLFFVFQQEYVFDAEDGHTEIMPVRRQL